VAAAALQPESLPPSAATLRPGADAEARNLLEGTDKATGAGGRVGSTASKGPSKAGRSQSVMF